MRPMSTIMLQMRPHEIAAEIEAQAMAHAGRLDNELHGIGIEVSPEPIPALAELGPAGIRTRKGARFMSLRRSRRTRTFQAP